MDLALLVACGSLALSVWLYLRDVWAKRAARFEVRAEMVPYTRSDGRFDPERRLILVNHGPADAHDIEAVPLDEDGERLEHQTIWGANPPTVFAGQTYVMIRERTQATRFLAAIDLSWRDQRGRQHQRHYVREVTRLS